MIIDLTDQLQHKQFHDTCLNVLKDFRYYIFSEGQMKSLNSSLITSHRFDYILSFGRKKNIAYPLKVYSRVQWTKYETCSILPRFHILYISSLINKHSLPIKSVQSKGMYQMRNLCNVAWVSYFVYLQQIQHIWIFSSFLEQHTQLTYWRCQQSGIYQIWTCAILHRFHMFFTFPACVTDLNIFFLFEQNHSLH